jgi:hypothetical protein
MMPPKPITESLLPVFPKVLWGNLKSGGKLLPKLRIAGIDKATLVRAVVLIKLLLFISVRFNGFYLLKTVKDTKNKEYLNIYGCIYSESGR